MPRLGMRPDEFGRYVWKLYFTRFGLEWTLSVLILSMGGLLRERTVGTADDSLSLPVSRRMWMAVRGSMAIAGKRPCSPSCRLWSCRSRRS